MTENDEIVRPGLCHHLTKEIPAIKCNLLSKVTKATYREVRRSKEPLYSAILQELEEDNFQITKLFLEHIIQTERNLMKDADGLKKRKFSDFPNLLEDLIDIFKESEIEDKPAKILGVIKKLIKFAELIDTKIVDLKWIVEFVLLKALNESRKIVNDNGKLQAINLRLLGNFYARRNSFELSLEKYEEGLLLSANKMWTISDSDFTLLNSKICSELSFVLLSLANESFKTDQEKCRKFAEKAIKLAEESNDCHAIGNAYSSVGELFVKFQNYNEAKDMFQNAMKHYRMEGNFSCICKTEINFVKSCLKLSEFDICKNHIEKAIKIGTTNALTSELAEAYATYGDVYRKMGETFSAYDNYFKSVELYNSLGNKSKMRKVRCLAAISMAQNVINPYIDMVIKSDAKDFGENPYMDKLLKWADTREPFWEGQSKDKLVKNSDSNYSANTIISDDGKMDEAFKQVEKRNWFSSDSILLNKIYEGVTKTRQSYSIFQLFREEAIYNIK